MSSIGSAINSISSSLLSEITSFNAKQRQGGTNTPSTTAATPATASDSVDFSQIGQVLKDLKQLETSDPAEFKQVLTDAAAKFKAAAGQTTDTKQAAFLNNLADKFQTAATTGNLSALTAGGSSQSANGLYSAHGRHHHHHAAEETASASSSPEQNTVSSIAS